MFLNARDKQKKLGGRLPSKALFDEVTGIYNLTKFRELFLEIGDIYEYQAATKLVGSWQEWLRLKRDWPGFCEHVSDWVAELDIIQKSEAALTIVTLSKKDTAAGLSAAKWIAEGHHGKAAKQQVRVGRPTKKSRAVPEHTAKDTREAAAEAERVAEACL